jgi:hypothetical protein
MTPGVTHYVVGVTHLDDGVPSQCCGPFAKKHVCFVDTSPLAMSLDRAHDLERAANAVAL